MIWLEERYKECLEVLLPIVTSEERGVVVCDIRRAHNLLYEYWYLEDIGPQKDYEPSPDEVLSVFAAECVLERAAREWLEEREVTVDYMLCAQHAYWTWKDKGSGIGVVLVQSNTYAEAQLEAMLAVIDEEEGHEQDQVGV